MSRYEIEPIRPMDSSYFETPVAPTIPEGVHADWGIYRVDNGVKRYLPTLYKTHREAVEAEIEHATRLAELKLGTHNRDDFEYHVASERGKYRIDWINEFTTYQTTQDKFLAHGVDDNCEHEPIDKA